MARVGSAERSGAWWLGPPRLPGALVSMEEDSVSAAGRSSACFPRGRCSPRVGRPQGGRGTVSRQSWAVAAGFWGSSRPLYEFSDLLRLLGPGDKVSQGCTPGSARENTQEGSGDPHAQACDALPLPRGRPAGKNAGSRVPCLCPAKPLGTQCPGLALWADPIGTFA